MARAKRTDRAEARRKYRAYLATEAAAEAAPEEEEPEAPPAGRWRFPGMPHATSTADVGANSRSSAPAARAASGGGSATPPARPGIFGAMRAAYHPIHYREDFAYLPTLVTRTHAVWPSLVLVVGGLVVVGASRSSEDFLTQAAAMAITPFPIIPPMLAGFFAPRASWLAGVISGLLSGVAYVGLLVQSLPEAQKLNPGLKDVSGGELAFFMGQALFYAATFGALFGATSGWYKRWLSLSGASGFKNQGKTGANARRQRTTSSARRKPTRP